MAVGSGETVLAWAETHDGRVIAGTRDAIYLDGVRLPWEDVEAADWDRESDRFRVSEVGTWGEPRRWQKKAAAAGRTELVFTC